MGWAERNNNNPDKGKEKPKKLSKREVERVIQTEIHRTLLKRLLLK